MLSGKKVTKVILMISFSPCDSSMGGSRRLPQLHWRPLALDVLLRNVTKEKTDLEKRTEDKIENERKKRPGLNIIED